MKSLTALPFVVLMLMSAQASALCTYITQSYGGIIQPGDRITAHGPFEVTSTNGCLNANVDATVMAGGAGRAPKIYIEGEVGVGVWSRLTYSLGTNASWVGPFGRYRVTLHNDETTPKAYSGTVRYGR